MAYTTYEVIQYVEENDVKFIKLFFTDIFGSIRSISVQPSMLKKAFDSGISFDASSVPGYLTVEKSDLLLKPDPSTLTVLPWRPQHGRVARLYCNIVYPDGKPFEGDSRYILQQTAEKALKMGYEVKVGTECEFYLFKLDENGKPTDIPYDNAGYCDLAPWDKGENIRRDIILNMEQMGIEPQTSHHETGPGQNEVDFKYDNAINSADNFATFKTTVYTIAARDGAAASFDPKPFMDKPGSGLHLNISIYRDGKNLFTEKSKESQNFLAGVLNRIREISIFLNSKDSSYKRLGAFEAPEIISWSEQNRSALVRIPAAEGDSCRMELRSPDPSCNQYLGIASVIQAGLEGIEKSIELPPPLDLNLSHVFEIRNCVNFGFESVSISESLESDKNMKDLIKKYGGLPLNLDEALNLACESDFVKTFIPESLLTSLKKLYSTHNYR